MSASHTLPRPLTSFIGRGSELANIMDLLSTTRLLTLTGPGGSGKTRLALQAAAACAAGYADGACFVDLAPISDPDLVIPTIAHALGLHERDGQARLRRLIDYLRDQALLLILDNFEQVLPAAIQLAALLSAAPQLTLLVTSRAALRISGEQEFAVPPLALPPPDQLPPLEQLAQSEAVQLFVARARSVKPDFALTPENAPAVVAICRRLDGLPLAIELAAARIKLLPPEALLARLEASLMLLTNGVGDGPTRHRTLRNAIAWSYDLLDEGERRLFRQLAAFVGGFTLEAAETVLRTEGRGLSEEAATSVLSPHSSVLDGLTSLLDKSLVMQQGQINGEPRFAMLETIREYALAQLAESAEAEPLRRCHAEFYRRLAEQAEQELVGSQQQTWLARLEIEHDNLRAALAWALASASDEERALALRLAGSLWRFWYIRGYTSEGRSCLERALAISKVGRPAPGTPETSQVHLEQQQTHMQWRAKALNGAGNLALLLDDLAAAQALHEENLAIRRALGDKVGIAGVLNNLGLVASRLRDYTAAQARCAESLELFRELGNSMGIAIALNSLAQAMAHGGTYAAARPLYEESLALFRELGGQAGAATALHNLGMVAYHQSDYPAARAFLSESLAIHQELGDKAAIADDLDGFAGLLAKIGVAERAATLLGASETLRGTSDSHPPAHQADYLAIVCTQIQAQLGAEFETTRLDGRALSLDEAVALALRELPPATELNQSTQIASSTHVHRAAQLPDGPDALTAREVEVLRLVATGLSNKAVAERLTLSLGTIQNYLHSIYGKLGVTSRSAATRYAWEHHLLARDAHPMAHAERRIA